jgi:2-polyprenyl-3-methyl-5-hydroxy-6-metoxy-1,4-benzoquinol methylase
LAQHKHSKALLDPACSSGAFLEHMRSEAWKLYGIEMSSEVARTAETRSCGQVLVRAALEASFQLESFEIITCFEELARA